MKLAASSSVLFAILISNQVAPAQGLRAVGTNLVRPTINTQNIAGRSKIVLRIYDFDQIEPATMAEARAVASEILRQAGLQAFWVECPLEGRCATDAEGPEFRLRIVPKHLGEQMVSDEPLGIAMPCASSEQVCLIYIFNARIKSVAQANHIEPGQLLGHVLAHELGHPLLGTNAHSPYGIMQHKLPISETARILCFTSQQAKHMRGNLKERIQMLKLAMSVQRVPSPQIWQ